MEGIALFLKRSILGALIVFNLLLCLVARTGEGVRWGADYGVEGVLIGLPRISSGPPHVWETASADLEWRKHFRIHCKQS